MGNLLQGHRLRVMLFVLGLSLTLAYALLLIIDLLSSDTAASLSSPWALVAALLAWAASAGLSISGRYPSFRTAMSEAITPSVFILTGDAYKALPKKDNWLQWGLLSLAAVFTLLLPIYPSLAAFALSCVLTVGFLRARPLIMPVEETLLKETGWVKSLGITAEQEYGLAMKNVVDQERPITFYEYALLRSFLTARYVR